ncbi:MAG: fibronectin type III domain-containing protein, partial [Nocardioidaceae bacterium]
DVDAAVFSDVRANYDCQVGNGPVGPCSTTSTGAKTIVHHVTVPPGTDPEEDAPDDGVQNDGIDTVTNMERLVFADSEPPGKPTNVTATAGNQSVTVEWARPARGAIDEYQVEVLDEAGNRVRLDEGLARNASSHVVSFLENGATYRLRVRARNAAGLGEFSVLSNPVTPEATVPPAPTLTRVVAGDREATVHWTGPDDDGGMPITGYQVLVTDATGTQVGALRPAPAGATSVRVTGLTNGDAHWFQVRAVNAIGNGDWSAESAGVTPGTSPGAATILSVLRRNSAAVVRWSPPADDGGVGVSDFRIRVTNSAGSQVGPLRVANAAAGRLRVNGLVNGREYRFRVAAVNAMGQGPFSRRSRVVVPAGRPDAPGIRRAGWGSRGGEDTARAFWSAPESHNGSRVTGYRVRALRLRPNGNVASRRVSAVQPRRARSFEMALRRGRYRFQVRAINDVGGSPWSEESNVARSR